jgi:hypothetical protein
MGIEITIPIELRQGTITTPNKKINSALARQTVKCTVQIPVEEREEEGNFIKFTLEQSTDKATWFAKAFFTWEGGVIPPPPPGVPEKPYQDPGIIFQLSDVKGYWVRAVVEIPVAMQVGLTVESI